MTPALFIRLAVLASIAGIYLINKMVHRSAQPWVDKNFGLAFIILAFFAAIASMGIVILLSGGA